MVRLARHDVYDQLPATSYQLPATRPRVSRAVSVSCANVRPKPNCGRGRVYGIPLRERALPADCVIGVGVWFGCGRSLRRAARLHATRFPGKQVVQVAVDSEERAGQDHRLSVVVSDRADGTIGVDLEDARVRYCQQDRRVRGDEELRTVLCALPDADLQRQTAVHRQRGFGLVEDVQSVRPEAVYGEIEERFAM